MPVDLTKLPQTLPPLKKFNWWFWTIALLVFIVIGSMTIVIISFFYSISNLLFVLGALILPAAAWLLTFLYGIYYRGYREAYIKEWNLHREARRKQLIDYARRGLYVLQYSLVTAYGEGGNANGVVSNQYAITAKSPNSGGSPIPHSALTLPHNVSSSLFYERLQALFKTWQQEYKSLFTTLPIDLNIHVRLFIDTNTKVSNLETLWLKTLGKIIHSTSFSIEDAKNSSTFIEQWLDNSDHDDDLLLVVNAHLFSSPSQNEAESAVLLLLAGEQAIKTLPFAINQTSLAKIYRCEQTDNLNQTIDNALLWGDADDKAYDGVWYSGVSTEQNIEIMNHFNLIEFDHGDIFNIDTSIGNAKDSAYFLALSLAIEQALNTQNKELIVIGQPNITASVVTTVTQNSIREQK